MPPPLSSSDVGQTPPDETPVSVPVNVNGVKTVANEVPGPDGRVGTDTIPELIVNEPDVGHLVGRALEHERPDRTQRREVFRHRRVERCLQARRASTPSWETTELRERRR